MVLNHDTTNPQYHLPVNGQWKPDPDCILSEGWEGMQLRQLP